MFTAEAASDDTRTRVVRLHEDWVPHGYQRRAVKHLMENHAAALFLDPGLGKTAITLEAFRRLKEADQVERMLVVAPLRVCQLVWEQEGKKWSQFRDLTFTLLHGTKKDDRLHEQTDIHLINPEGIAWFTRQFFGQSQIPYDVVAIDELTKFKNHRAKRSKALRKKLKQTRYRWGLTGSPAPNGYMDLFGQMLILDDGASLGRYITYFRDQYFNQGWDGFSYELRNGAAERIEEKIAPYVLRMSSEDYLELPPLVDHIIEIDLPPATRAQYDEMKKEMLLTLPEGVVTGANSGAVYSKLKQMSNGAVYLSDAREGHDSRKKKWTELHSHKLDALEELIEELSGQPLLVAYEFQHDLDRLRERLGDDTPTLSGLTHTKIEEVEGKWNRGELPVLLVHPASAGHGLNLQGAGASHICWFSRPWDLEMYDQTIRRIYRQGSTSERVVNHVLSVRGTMDEIVGEALKSKDTTQNRLLTALNAEIQRDDPATTPKRAEPTESSMALKKLGFKGPATSEPDDTPDEKPATPKGWGKAPTEAPEPQEAAADDADDAPVKPKGWGPPEGTETPESEQRAAIKSRLRGATPDAPADEEEEEEEVPPSVKALDAFPKGVVEQLNGDDADDASEEEEAPEEEDPWGDLGTRYVNALEAAGLESAVEAHSYGKKELIDNVPGFGSKGWEELSAMFPEDPEGHGSQIEAELDEDEEEEAEETTDEAPRPKGWAPPASEQAEKAEQDEGLGPDTEYLAKLAEASETAKEAQARMMERGRDLYGVAAPPVSINISIHGVPREALAALFTTLANQYAGE